MDIPSESDINVYDSPDEVVARDHFLGKTVEQAEALFRENSAYYQEDLMWMGPRAFAYYLQSAIRYLKSEHAEGDDHLISCLYDIITFRSETAGLSMAVDGVREVVDYVLSNYDKFAVDQDIYGDLFSKYVGLQGELEAST